MKICKQIAAAALSVCLLLPIGACSFSLNREKPIAYRVTYTSDDESISDAVATEEIDAALLERGYSEQFVDWTGDETKRMLFEEDAVCQSLAGVSAGRVPVDERYIYGIAAVSALPAEEEGVVRKIATFSWQWQGEERRSGDYISLGWQWDSPSGYTLVPEQTMFELSGKGDKRDERWKGSIQIPPMEEGTFLLRRGAEAISRNIGDKSFEYDLSIDPGYMFRRIYYRGLAQSGAMYEEGYGDYSIRPGDYCGSYSLGLVKHVGSGGTENGVMILRAGYYQKEETAASDYRIACFCSCFFDYSSDNRYAEKFE